jgi:predicted metal-dependent enzyme (double-stranded beta helix superfamily)
MQNTQNIFKIARKIAESVDIQQKVIKSIENKTYNSDYNSLINSIKALDDKTLGIKDKHYTSKCINAIKIFEDNLMTIAIYAMSSGTYFPMHDHPGMLGISYILKGEVSYSTYDIPLHQNTDKHKPFPTIKSKSPLLMAFTPNKNNLHSIKAEINSILFDIFIPSYGLERYCTYYKITRSNTIEPYMPLLNFRESPYDGEPFY